MSTKLTSCVVHVLAGVASCVLLFEKIIPFLSGKSTVGLEVPAAQKQKTQ